MNWSWAFIYQNSPLQKLSVSLNCQLKVTALYELPDSYPRMDPPWSGSRTCKSIWDNYYYTKAVCSLLGTLERTEEIREVIEIASHTFRGICLVIQLCYMVYACLKWSRRIDKLQKVHTFLLSKSHPPLLHSLFILSYLNLNETQS